MFEGVRRCIKDAILKNSKGSLYIPHQATDARAISLAYLVPVSLLMRCMQVERPCTAAGSCRTNVESMFQKQTSQSLVPFLFTMAESLRGQSPSHNIGASISLIVVSAILP